jgi:hypothetical protein
MEYSVRGEVRVDHILGLILSGPWGASPEEAVEAFVEELKKEGLEKRSVRHPIMVERDSKEGKLSKCEGVDLCKMFEKHNILTTEFWITKEWKGFSKGFDS